MNAIPSLSTEGYIRHCLAGGPALEILHDSHGKPFAVNSTFSFNPSHSSSMIALYVSDLSDAVGCDIQRCDRKYSEQEIAKLAFEEDEISWFQENNISFFLMWSMKEAFAKADGRSIFSMHSLGSIMGKLEMFRVWHIRSNGIDYYLSVYPAYSDVTICPESSMQVQQCTLPLFR